MMRWPTRTSALSMVLFGAVQAIAQPADDHSAETGTRVQIPVERPIEVERATLFNKLRWAGLVFVNPDSTYDLVPLFGYSISRISDHRLGDALAAAMAGDVRIALLNPRSTGSDSGSDNVFEGRGVQIADGIDNEQQLLEAWSSFRASTNVQDDAIIAFTRPLLGLEAEEEFVATARLWPQADPRLAAMDSNPSVAHDSIE